MTKIPPYGRNFVTVEHSPISSFTEYILRIGGDAHNGEIKSRNKGSVNMEDNKWNSNTIKMESHFEAYPNSPQKLAVLSLVAAGNEDPTTRDNAWNAITAMMRGVENSPIGRGRQADIDPEIEAALTKALVPYHAAAVAHYVDLTTTCGESIIWGRGGINYDSAEEYADAQTATKKSQLIRALRANESPKDSDRVLWDGSSNKKGHLTGITLVPKPTTEDA